PAAIFVNAMDTNPLAADLRIFLRDQTEAFDAGLHALSRLCEGPTYLCVAPQSDFVAKLTASVITEEFVGPHPAGTVGYHVHTLLPAHRGRVVFTTTYQEVVAI